MNTHIAYTVAAVVLSVSAMAAPALAQSYTAPAGIPSVTAPGGLEGRSYDDITTGSIGYARRHDSAQEGNAEQPNFPVKQYGRASGGLKR